MIPAGVPLELRWSHALRLAIEHFLGRERVDRWWPSWRAGAQQRLAAALHGRRPGELVRIDERRDLSLGEFLSDYLGRARPVVLKGAAQDWPCCRRWDFDFLADHHGDYPSNIPENEGLIDPRAPQDFEELSLGDYIAHLRAGGRKYLKFSQLLMDRPEMLVDVDTAWLRARRGPLAFLEEFQLFVGPRGSHTPLHCAMPSNLFVQVHGTKRWNLFPTLGYPVIDPPAARFIYFYSDFDPRSVDGARFPAASRLDGYDVLLEPGDVLYNPGYMWHCVTNLTDTIGIGYRFTAPLQALRASALLTILNLLATKPSLPEALYYSRVAKTKTIHVAKAKR